MTGFVPLQYPTHQQLQPEGPPSLPGTSVVMLQSMEAEGRSVISEAFSKQKDYSLKQLLHTTFCAHVPSLSCLWALLTQPISAVKNFSHPHPLVP